MATSNEQAIQRRDVTRAKKLAEQLLNGAIVMDATAAAMLQEIVKILTDIDARTGRRDPSKRRKKTAASLG